MEKKVFIQSNKSQHLGAVLGKYSIERQLPKESNVTVEIMEVECIPFFKDFVGKTYLQGSERRTYSLQDEQSFTLTRFLPPELMHYQGRAIAIDPDVFAVKDISSLFDTELMGAPVACCKREHADFWDTSVILYECASLQHWSMRQFLHDLSSTVINYNTLMRKVLDEKVHELKTCWNSLDHIDGETRFVHMTRQRTQPWKTGLPYTVTPRSMGKYFGLVPKKWLGKGKEKYPKYYQEHPDPQVRSYFFSLVSDALKDSVVTKQDIQQEIDAGRIRKDLFECLPY